MNYSEIKKIARLLEYENNCRILHKEFIEHGVRFYDAHGWGFIRNGIKHYQEKS
jgi:hypothetical protein